MICLSETWFKKGDHPYLYLLPGYKQYIFKNRIGKGGGVIIQVYDDMPPEKLQNSFAESILDCHREESHTMNFCFIQNPQCEKKVFTEILKISSNKIQA